MHRHSIAPRIGWQSQVDALGFDYHSPDGKTYWDESACYSFTEEEIDGIESLTNELEQMCLQAVQHIIDHNLFSRMAIPPQAVPLIMASWKRGDKNLYGRFDLAYDGKTAPKLLEYNADTPTSLLEAAVVQWQWLEATHPDKDQFNSIHERLIDTWQRMKLKGGVHFACVPDHAEDYGNTLYLQDTAAQAGLATKLLSMPDIGSNGQQLFDLENAPITNLFKLYPWEWLVQEDFAPTLATTRTIIIEPAWKMLLSNKAVLVILWELFEGHPNLLNTSFSAQDITGDSVKKPIYGREGSNITLTTAHETLTTAGEYGEEGFVYQQYHELPDFNGNFPIIGSWVVASQAAGIGIREDNTRITKDSARFVPHYFE